MTTLISTLFETGPLGSAVTTTKEPNFTQVFGAWVYDNAHAIGSLSARCDTGAGPTTASLIKTFTAVTDLSMAWTAWLETIPGATMVHAQVNNGAAVAAQVKVLPTGAIAIANAASTVATSLWTYTAPNALHLEWNLSSVTGMQELRIYDNVGALVEVLTGIYTTGTPTRTAHGVVGVPPPSYHAWVDNLTVTDVYTPPLPPSGAITTFVSETFEAGTIGNPLTTSSTAFDNLPGGGMTFDNTYALGAKSARCDSLATATAQVMEETFAATDDVTLTCVMWLPVLPVATGLIVASLVGTTTVAQVRVETDGTLSLLNGGVAVGRTLVPIVPGVRTGLEWHVNGSLTNQELRIYVGPDQGTTHVTDFVSGPFTALPITTSRVGLVAHPAANYLGWFDNVLVTDETVPPLVPPPITTLLDETFELGTNGAALTAANTQLDSFAGTVVFDNAIVKRGLLACKFNSGIAGDNVTIRSNFADVTSGRLFLRWYAYYTAGVGITSQTAHVADGATLQAGVYLNTNSTVRITNGSTLQQNSTKPLPLFNWCRFDWTIDLDLNLQSLGIYLKVNREGSTPTETLTGAFTGDIISNAMWGAISGHPVSWVAYVDDVAISIVTMPPPTGAPGDDTTYRRVAKAGLWHHAVTHRL